MKQRLRIYYTESQKSLMWERWRQGDSLQTIAQLFGRNHSSIQRILAETGGIRPARAMSFMAGIDVGRTRRDIARTDGGPVSSFDCGVAQTGTIDGKPRDQA